MEGRPREEGKDRERKIVVGGLSIVTQERSLKMRCTVLERGGVRGGKGSLPASVSVLLCATEYEPGPLHTMEDMCFLN